MLLQLKKNVVWVEELNFPNPKDDEVIE